MTTEHPCVTTAPEGSILAVQTNLSITYERLGRLEEAMRMKRDVYSGWLRLHGEESAESLTAAANYAAALQLSLRIEEAKSLLRKTMPVARRARGESHIITLRMRIIYACALYEPDDATLVDLREAVTTLEETERIARRVLGGEHPLATTIDIALQNARAALRARETPSTSN